MKKNNYVGYRFQIYFVISILFFFNLSIQEKTNSQVKYSNSEIKSINAFKDALNPIFVAPKPPKDFGAPSRRTSAGSRSNRKKTLVALAPLYKDFFESNEEDTDLVFGKTAIANPTFWFYTPYTSSFKGEFILKDDQGVEIYKGSINLPKKSGIFSLSLPSKISLAVNRLYYWELNISLKSGEKPLAFVDGWIQRQNLDFDAAKQIARSNFQDQIQIYGENGFWYDALNASSNLRKTNLKEENWFTLLKEIRLDKLAPEPLLECCSF